MPGPNSWTVVGVLAYNPAVDSPVPKSRWPRIRIGFPTPIAVLVANVAALRADVADELTCSKFSASGYIAVGWAPGAVTQLIALRTLMPPLLNATTHSANGMPLEAPIVLLDPIITDSAEV